jgi:hypothetical protein
LHGKGLMVGRGRQHMAEPPPPPHTHTHIYRPDIGNMWFYAEPENSNFTLHLDKHYTGTHYIPLWNMRLLSMRPAREVVSLLELYLYEPFHATFLPQIISLYFHTTVHVLVPTIPPPHMLLSPIHNAQKKESRKTVRLSHLHINCATH